MDIDKHRCHTHEKMGGGGIFQILLKNRAEKIAQTEWPHLMVVQTIN